MFDRKKVKAFICKRMINKMHYSNALLRIRINLIRIRIPQGFELETF